MEWLKRRNIRTYVDPRNEIVAVVTHTKKQRVANHVAGEVEIESKFHESPDGTERAGVSSHFDEGVHFWKTTRGTVENLTVHGAGVPVHSLNESILAFLTRDFARALPESR